MENSERDGNSFLLVMLNLPMNLSKAFFVSFIYLFIYFGIIPSQLSWLRICLQCKRPWLNSWVRNLPWRRDRLPSPVILGFPGGSAGKESTCNVADLGLILGLGRPPGEGKTTHSSILAWRISWTVQSMGLQRVGT